MRESSRMPRPIRFAIGVAIVAVVLIAGAAGVIALLHPGVEQPIPYSHRLHAGRKDLSCFFCHSTATRAAHAGLPSVDKCLLCHNVIASQFPPIRQIRLHEQQGESIRWRRVNVLPDFVRFAHAPHLAQKIDCGRCHGNVKAMDRVEQVHEFSMKFCVDCHRENAAPVECVTCHY